ncbi:MAG: hypothetical protein IJG31_04350 [Fusobacterium sp.]|nr:hypothetical protein [Fusobacterium sp.]
MTFKFKIENKLNIKFIILILVYLFFFYFFIIKSIFSYMDLKEYLLSERTKNEKLTLENSELKKVLEIKKENFIKESQNLENPEKKKLYEKKNFNNISEALNFIDETMLKNNISFESIARYQKDEDIISVSLSFSASEKNIKKFFYDLENSHYFFNLSNKYFKIFINDELSAKLSVQFRVNDKLENETLQNNIIKESDFIFKSNPKNSKKSSYMRIGNNKIYKNKVIEQ